MVRIGIDPVALRGLLPDLVLREGGTVVARVAARGPERGTLVLAGAPLLASLPDEVRAGDVLRLRVAEVTAERVHLRVVDEPAVPAAAHAPAPPPVVPPAGIPVPGGLAALRVTEEEGEAGAAPGEERGVVALRWDSPRLGRLDLRLRLEPGALLVTVRTPPGASTAEVREGVHELAEALGGAAGRPARVTVEPRREPVELYA